MENQKEPTLEEYGLTTSSYEEVRYKKINLEIDLSEYKKEFNTLLIKINNDELSFLNDVLSFLFICSPFVAIFTFISFFDKFSLMNVSIFVSSILFIIFMAQKCSKERERKNEISIKIKEKQNDYKEKTKFLREIVNSFEDSVAKYYENYLEQFFKDNLYKKRSGSDKFEQSLADFSLMIDQVKNEVRVINEKMIFRYVHPYYHESYLANRQINHSLQKDKKQLFYSFNNIKTQEEIQEKIDLVKEINPKIETPQGITKEISTDSNKKIKEEFWKNRDQGKLESNKFNLQKNPIINEQINISEEKTEKKGFWAEIMDNAREEIEKDNNKSNIEENKIEKIKQIEIISPEKRYHTPRKIDWDEANKNKKITGLKGEEIVLEIERDYLNSINMGYLAEQIKHISKDDGDGAGYDILSFYPDGQKKYIEVKSTMKSGGNSFYLSKNELDFLRSNKYNTCIYKIFNVNEGEDIPHLKVHTANDILIKNNITPVQYVVKMD